MGAGCAVNAVSRSFAESFLPGRSVDAALVGAESAVRVHVSECFRSVLKFATPVKGEIRGPFVRHGLIIRRHGGDGNFNV